MLHYGMGHEPRLVALSNSGIHIKEAVSAKGQAKDLGHSIKVGARIEHVRIFPCQHEATALAHKAFKQINSAQSRCHLPPPRAQPDTNAAAPLAGNAP